MKKRIVLFFVLAGIVVFFGMMACNAKPQGFLRILCMGDSVTESRYGSYPKHLKHLLRHRFPRATLFTAAKPGFTSGEYLDFLRRSKATVRIRPDIVLLMLGTNDVRIDSDRTELPAFSSNLRRIVDLILEVRSRRGKRPTILLATIPPIFASDLVIFDDSSSQRISAEINPTIRDLSRRRRLVSVEMEALFLRNRALLSGVHPTAAGYRQIAETFFLRLVPLLETD